jgi:T-complex protein 11
MAATTQRPPLLERTSRWFRAAIARVGAGRDRATEPRQPPTSSIETGDDTIGKVLRDAIMELIFRPDDAVPVVPTEPTTGPVAYFARLSSSLSKRHHHHGGRRHHHHRRSTSSSSQPQHQLLPETLQLDAFRIQTLHADVTDLTVVYMLLMLFRQLVGPHHSRLADAGVLDDVRKEIWLFLNEAGGARTGSGEDTLTAKSTTAAGSCRRGDATAPAVTTGVSPGLRKLECESWRQGMKDVMLQIAARAKAFELAAEVTTTDVAADARLPLPTPDTATLGILASWMDTNLRPGAKLFELMQARLRETIAAVVEDESCRHQQQQRALGVTRSWWLPGSLATDADASTASTRSQLDHNLHNEHGAKQQHGVHVDHRRDQRRCRPLNQPSSSSTTSSSSFGWSARAACSGHANSAQRSSLIVAAQVSMAGMSSGCDLRGRKRLSRTDDDDDEDGEAEKEGGRGTRLRLSEDSLDDRRHEYDGGQDAGAGAIRRRSRAPSPPERPTTQVKFAVPVRARLTADEALARNGLQQLAGEVRTLGARVSRLASFHLAVYNDWYRDIATTSVA